MSWRRRLARLIPQNRAGVITLILALGIATFVVVEVIDPLSESETNFNGERNTNPAVLDAVYADLIDAVTEQGKVLYTRRVSEGRGGDPVVIEAWTDQATYSYRQHNNGEASRIVVGAERYSPNATRPGYGLGPAPRCHGKFEQAIASMLQCESSLRDLVVSVVLDSKYKGTPAVDIVATGEFYGDWTLHVEEHVYLDKATMLPLAVVRTRELADGDEVSRSLSTLFPDRRTTTFEHSFVDRESLPTDFFDPASIGAQPWDPAELLETDVGILLYWLGRESSGVRSLPELILDNVNVFPDTRPPGRYSRRASLYYSGPREFALGLLSIDVWSLGDWKADIANTISPERNHLPAAGLWWTWPCTKRTEVTIPGKGSAIIYWRVELTYDQYPVEDFIGLDEPLPPGPCIEGEPDEFLVHAEFGDTFIVMRPHDPYASREALEELVQLLRPFGG